MNIYKKLYERLSKMLVPYIIPYINTDDKVLDLGSGNGYISDGIIKKTGADLICVDVIDIHKVGPKPIIYNGINIPFKDKEFDTTLLLYALHHVKDKEKLFGKSFGLLLKKLLSWKMRTRIFWILC